MDFFITILLAIVLTLGVIFVFGFIVGLCNKILIKNLGVKIYKATAIVGTPIHEIGHVLMCLLFGHKIVEVKLLDLQAKDQMLGYVKHSYNKRNIYHRIGNFFIGIGPIILGTAILTILLLICPNSFNSFATSIESIDMSNFWTIVCSIFTCIWNLFITLFSFKDGFAVVIYLLIGLLISAHMSLSNADIKGSLDGIIFIIIIYIILALIFLLCGAINTLKLGFIYIGSYLIMILMISLLFCILQLIISCVIRLFRRK